MSLDFLSNIWFYLGTSMFFVYNLMAISFAGAILEKPDTSKWYIIINAAINCMFMGLILILQIPHYLIYILFCVVLTLEFKITFKSGYRQTLFGSVIYFFHISSIHVLTIISMSLIHGVAPISFFNSSAMNYQSAFVTFAALAIILIIFKKIVPIDDVKKISKAKTYSPIITGSAFLMMLYISFDSLFLITDNLYPEILMISLSSTIFAILLFYYLFLFSSNLVNLHVYKRKSDKAHSSYKKLIDKKNEMEEKLSIDSLTKLYNRDYVYSKLDELCKSNEMNFGVIFIDLVALKYTNDTFGHDAGDRYITRIATAIKESIRDYDIGARIGGDEFLILLSDVERQELTNIISRLKYNVSRQNDIEEFLVHASIGSAYIDKSEEISDMQSILEIADERMRKDKSDFYSKMVK